MDFRWLTAEHISILVVIGGGGIFMWRFMWSRAVTKHDCQLIMEAHQKLHEQINEDRYEIAKDIKDIKSDMARCQDITSLRDSINILTDHMLNGAKK